MTPGRRRLVPFSAPLRVALVSLAFSLLISVPVLLFVYHQTDILFERRVREGIDDRQQDLLYGYAQNGVAGVVGAIREEIDTGTARNGVVLLAGADGHKIAGNIASWPAALRAGVDWTEVQVQPRAGRQPVPFAVRTIRLRTGEQLLIGTSVDDRERMRGSLVEALVAALLLALPLGLIGGFVVLKVTQRRARAVGRVAAQIAAGDFTNRLDERAEGAEFAMVASAINAMLERIEELVEQLRLVTDSLAHDLRSPLTRMRANIEKAAGYAAAEPEQQAIEAISTDIDRMLRLISATLEIGRAEAGMGKQQFEEFDLVELLRDIGEIYQPVAEECGRSIDFDLENEVRFFGDRQLIGRAVANLIDNALKYGGNSGAISLTAGNHADRVEIALSDHGPGIPAELREDAVRKYRRLEEARTTEGSGLGLAMVRAVARLHGGDISLSDNHPGLRAVMTLRREPPSGG